jgi:MFS family permease
VASRQEVAAVYAAAVVQGVALVAFPAVSAILTDPAGYHLTKTEYGGMFVPQAITAVLSSLLGAGLTRRTGAKRVLLVGLLADLAAMGLLFASKFFVARHPIAFGLLLAATGCLGCGFGFVVPTLNTFTAAFFPQRTDGAILTLNALLGVGTALAPIFALCFVGLGCWWGLPLLVGGSTLALWLFAQRLPLSLDVPRTADGSANTAHRKIEARFWIYAAFALVYGICETMNGNWASVYLSTNLAASTTIASLALTLFWVCVTGGRVLFAVVGRWLPPAWTYRALPLLLAGAFAGTAMVSRGQSVLGLLSFGVAGLGCSALLPLVVSFAQKELTAMGSAVAGGLIGFYQIGYGIGAFGVGPVENWAHLSLRSVFGGTAVLAIGLESIALVIVSGRHTNAVKATSP